MDLSSRMAVDGVAWRCHKRSCRKFITETRIIPGGKQDAAENIYFCICIFGVMMCHSKR